MNKPNMSTEVMEAIHGYFEDYPEVEVDCYRYLKALDINDCFVLHKKAEDELISMDRCPNCGELFEYTHIEEVHTELEGNPAEHLCEPYCPNCDGGNYE